MDLELYWEEDIDWEEEDRKIREEYADWNFINKQPSPIKEALEILVEMTAYSFAPQISMRRCWRVAAAKADISLWEINELRIKANIPIVS